jgi:hypothetical protein
MLFRPRHVRRFLIGGISGIFLSDIPADTTEHGSVFVMAHLPLLDHRRPDLRVHGRDRRSCHCSPSG